MCSFPSKPDESRVGPKEGLVENVLGLFKSSEYSDLTITTRDKTFEVHKALVCSRSEYFRKACRDEAWKEGQSGVINLQDDEDLSIPMNDPVSVEYMFRYLYGQDYMEEPEDYVETPDGNDSFSPRKKKKASKSQLTRRERGEVWPSQEDLSIPYEERPTATEFESDGSKKMSSGGNAAVHAQMCAIADFYGIPDLQEAARSKFRVAFNKIRSDQGIIQVFKLVCDPNFQSDMILRNIMVDKIAMENHLLDEVDIQNILQDDGELALAIAKRMRQKYRRVLS